LNALAQASLSQPRWSDVRQFIAPMFDEILSHVAATHHLSERSLRSVVLLHLPQFSFERLNNKLFLYNEVENIAQWIKQKQCGFENWVTRREIEPFHAGNFRTALVSEQTAQDLHTRFHYLHSAHAGESIGIYHQSDSVPTALVTISAMNVTVLQQYVPKGDIENARLLSRMFAFEWAPRNSISYLLGQVTRWMRQHQPSVHTFLTFVNPNVEFTGSSYRASNWELVGNYPTQYRYFDGKYISGRMFYELRQNALSSVQVSSAEYDLKPLEVWAYRIRK
jgi:hypothetical protein